MPKRVKRQSLTGSLRALFRHSRKVQCTESRPNEYYRHVYVEKRLYDGIEFLAKVDGTSRMRVANDLLELGLSTYIANEITKNDRIAIAARERSEPVKPTAFMVAFRRWIKKQSGTDIGRLV